ncbi:MAG: heme exporter protein CcmB [Bacteroidetes bacterium]|nr:heme exporter protein CcmB [Bacteroidota bacterium]
MGRAARTWLRSVWAVFRKEAASELRLRYGLQTLFVFAASALMLVSFAVRGRQVEPGLHAALLWVVLLFSAGSGLGRAFLSEEDRGTVWILRLHAPASAVYVGKWLFTLALTLLLSTLSVGAYGLLLGLSVRRLDLLALLLGLGSWGLSGVMTLLSALIARTSARGPLLAVLGLPVLIPVLLVGAHGTEQAIRGGGLAETSAALLALTGYAGAMFAASWALFDYVWQE